MFNLDAYLERVGLESLPPANEEGLRALHRAQTHAIPFENLDIQLGRAIDLAPVAIFDKLVTRKRGGYCFELNGLFFDVLLAVGFKVRRVLARVHIHGPPSARTHQFSVVTLDNQDWLVDTGFGAQSPRSPVRWELGRIHEHEGQRLRLIEKAPYGVMLQGIKDGEWADYYSTDLMHVVDADIAASNHFTSTHPLSPFCNIRMATMPTRDGGRKSLMDFQLKKVANGETTITELPDGPEYLEVLRSELSIDLGASYDALKPLGSAPG